MIWEAGKINHLWLPYLQSTGEWLNLTHKITREQSQMPTANTTFYCTLSALWQSYFSAIVESRANADHVTHSLMTQRVTWGEEDTVSMGICLLWEDSVFSPWARSPSQPVFWLQLWLQHWFSQKASWLTLSSKPQEWWVRTRLYKTIEQECGIRGKAMVEPAKRLITQQLTSPWEVLKAAILIS